MTGIEAAADISDIIKRTDYYLGIAPGSVNYPTIRDKNHFEIARFMNYCGFLATVIRVLPDDERDNKARELDTMCQGYFKGSYSPMCVTAEMVVPSEFDGDGKYGQNFWTMQQALYHTQNVNWPDSEITWAQINTTKTGAGKSSAGFKLTGRNPDGSGLRQYNHNGKTIRWYGDLIHSVDQALLDEKGIENAPIKGYGVFGLTSALAPPTTVEIPPTSEATLTAMGTISLLVEEKKYEKQPGGYSETFRTTMTVNLGSSMFSERSSDGDSTNGAGFANVLKWLALKRAEGKSFPNPSITVYLGQAAAIPALEADLASQLIKRTYGYFGNGDTFTDNDDGEQVSSNQEEASIGSPFTWSNVPLSLGGNVVLKDAGLTGVTVTTVESGIKFEINDLVAAYNYFKKNGDTLVLVGEMTGDGVLGDPTAKNQHWFKVGGDVEMYGPQSLNDMATTKYVNTNFRCRPKYDYSTITAYPDDQPYYYSRCQQPYSEFKQGTVPATGTGSSEKFNSMAGTPTFTDVSGREDFQGTPYQNAGKYYQYFASGGSEFVVQFDGEYVETAIASRTYTAPYTNVTCDHNWDPCQSPHTHGSNPPRPCSTCHQTEHCKHNKHKVGDTFTWTQEVNGFSYVKITNLKVWKLAEARLDGTRELLDTDEVKATVKTVAPSIAYNVADSDDASSGRFIYSYEPEQCDSVTIPGTPKASSNICATHTKDNADDLEGKIAGKTVNATCVSDFIVLRTSNGDQSVLYYEYKSKNEPAVGIRTGDSFYADPIEFDTVPYATIWTGNTQTSKGSKMPEDGVTYGGYSGNYQRMKSKYKSSGHASNINFDSTIAAQNPSKVFAPTQKPTQKFRLLNDEIIIPDYKQNGEYVLGNAEVFYENIVNVNEEVQPNYPIVAQSEFDGRRGFVTRSTYSPTHDKINDIVVYNPVSNQYAMILALPEERDQRIKHSATGAPPKTQVVVDYEIDCAKTDHVHTEACYQQISYEKAEDQPFTSYEKTFAYREEIQEVTLGPGTRI